jgi:hypothetical protein
LQNSQKYSIDPQSSLEQQLWELASSCVHSVPAFPRAVAEDGIQSTTTKKNHTTKTKEKYKKREIEFLPSIPLI